MKPFSIEKISPRGRRRLFLLLALAVLFLLLCLLCLPVIRWMLQPGFGPWLRERVERLGLWGVLAMFLLQVLQVVVAIIPGEPVEIAAGTMYGALGGLALCLAGILAGSAGVFRTVRRRGREAFVRTPLWQKLQRYSFLQDETRLEAMVFLLYLIPGTPKDVLVYVCALSGIPMGRFLLLSTTARIPSVVTSTWAGASFAGGDLPLTLGIFAATGILGLLGISFHERLLARKNQAAGARSAPGEKAPWKKWAPGLLAAALAGGLLFAAAHSPGLRARLFVGLYGGTIEERLEAGESLPAADAVLFGYEAVNRWDGAHPMTEFVLLSRGETLYGCYLSPDGLPLAFQNREADLTRTGGGWTWGEEGSWQGETSLIAGNWYYFEAVRPAG